MKKTFCIVISAILMFSFFNGCDRKDAIQVGNNTGINEKAIVKWMFWFPEPVEFIKAFNESQDEIRLEYEEVSGTNYPKVLNTRIAAGEAPDLYCIYFRETYEQQAKEKGIIDLTNKPIWQNFDSVAIEQNRAKDGRLYGMPTTASINCMFYNKEILDRYNISLPSNWKEFMNVCSKLKANGVAPQVQGMKDLWQCKYVGLSPVSVMLYKDQQWLERLNNGKVKWTDEDCLAQFKKKEEFIKKGYIHEGSLNMTFQQAWEVWCKGQAAFIAGGSYYINNVFLQLKPGFEWGVMPIPLMDAGSPVKVEYFTDNTTIVVNAKGKNTEKALKFIEWFARPENMNMWAKTTLNLSPGKDPNFSIDPAAEKFRELYKYEKFKLDREPDYIFTEFGKVQQEMLIGSKTPEQAVKELQDKTEISIKK